MIREYVSLMNIDMWKSSTIILVIQIQQPVKTITYYDKVGFMPGICTRFNIQIPQCNTS